MRRKDRERDAAFAWAVFDQAPFAVLSLRDGQGGYGVPVSPARVGEAVYFHCVGAGKKLDCLARWPEVSLTAAAVVSGDYFSCCYRSAVLRGRAVPVDGLEEKRRALEAVSRRYCPGDMADFDAYAAPRLASTAVYRIDVGEITGKERTLE